MRKNNRAIVILSYHKYSEMWPLIVESVKEHLPEFSIFIITDKIVGNPNRDQVTFIESNISDWGGSLKEGLHIIKRIHKIEVCLFTFDDLIITKINNEDIINKAFDLVLSNPNISSIKLSHPHLGYTVFDIDFNYAESKKYLTTLVFAVWDLSSLLRLLSNQFNPWSFEKEGYKFFERDKFVLATKNRIISYDNLIVKGKLVRGRSLNLKNFPKMSFIENLLYKIKLWLININNLSKS